MREPEDVRAARETSERAESQRQHVTAQEPEAERMGRILRDALEGNHFGEAIDRAMARKRST
jgi:hypothetical protein